MRTFAIALFLATLVSLPASAQSNLQRHYRGGSRGQRLDRNRPDSQAICGHGEVGKLVGVEIVLRVPFKGPKVAERRLRGLSAVQPSRHEGEIIVQLATPLFGECQIVCQKPAARVDRRALPIGLGFLALVGSLVA